MFHQILLQIFQKLNHERTISAAYHILRGKRSGQTIQDIGLFQLHPYFGLLPKLPREVFDETVALFQQYSWLEVQASGHYSCTKVGLQRAAQTPEFLLAGWYYRGNEHLFFGRLSLIIQSLSYHQTNTRSFTPISKDIHIQAWVRQFLLEHHYQQGHLQKQLWAECEQALKELPVCEENKQLMVYRLSGHQLPGWTWQQLAMERKETVLDCQLAFIELLHVWLNSIHGYPLLQQIAEGVRVQALLTDSAQQTAFLYEQGYSIDQIAQIRKLKQSTIEDHIVEMAMYEPNFSIGSFVTYGEAAKVWQASKQYQTKKLKILYEVIGDMSYFQLKLVLAKGEV
ncbi:helix-turn-helix domain-containing protein [Lysinibacillus piscis]|uniref:ATP-dependent DNA helicase RecQ n=1 Tax=Lysinibacillus piscis TaxID=2518931 RepID=A0ABQ5NFN8_9BACI|nr:helix-turn-helix domain-containing protein [Lysinibacillus sp. KH24]GLC87095.1 ATP-dependent DNA helicase RecQ [Lysinibacillus sp. KH24]